MPVKKNTTKKSAAKSSPRRSSSARGIKKASREERAQIREAVNSLPHLLTEQRQELPPAPPQQPPQVSPPPAPSHKPRYISSQLEKKKRLVLNMVVGITMIFIVTLWVINVYSQFNNAKFHLGSDETLWETGKTDFTKLVTEPRKKQKEEKDAQFFASDQPTKELSPQEIKEILVQNLSTLVTTTSSSSTLGVTSSTAPFTTSTLTSTTTEP